MKTITAITAVTLALLPATLLAEGKGKSDWAEEAAQKYEHKAKWAEKEGMPRAAAIYRRMAQIKRDAGQASRQGRDFSWEEYHKLEGQLNQIKNERQKHVKKGHKKEHAGDGFLRAAEDYRRKARMAREKGDSDKAQIYMKLAGHKVAAAQAAKEGQGYDWSEYKALQKQLHGDKGDCDKPKHEPKKDWNTNDKPAGKLNIE